MGSATPVGTWWGWFPFCVVCHIASVTRTHPGASSHAVAGVAPAINKLQKARAYSDVKPPATKMAWCRQGDHECPAPSVLPAGAPAAQGHCTGRAGSTGADGPGWHSRPDPAQPLTPRAPAVACLVFPVSNFSSDEELQGSDSKCQAPGS